jgi:hypothetical protein
MSTTGAPDDRSGAPSPAGDGGSLEADDEFAHKQT